MVFSVSKFLSFAAVVAIFAAKVCRGQLCSYKIGGKRSSRTAFAVAKRGANCRGQLKKQIAGCAVGAESDLAATPLREKNLPRLQSKQRSARLLLPFCSRK